jgi:phosphate transport system protein
LGKYVEGELPVAKEHTIRAYGQELDELKARILEMAAECKGQLARAVCALKEQDTKLALDIIEGDTRINSLQAQVDELAIRMLALRQPMALDLRNIVAAQKIAADFERIADYAANIARHTIHLDPNSPQKPIVSIVEMGSAAVEMLRHVVDAYRKLDIEKAVEVWHRDKEIDKIYFGLLTQLRTVMIEDSKHVTASTNLLFIGRCCERIGDHITNVAESVHFIVSGEMHHGTPMKLAGNAVREIPS